MQVAPTICISKILGIRLDDKQWDKIVVAAVSSKVNWRLLVTFSTKLEAQHYIAQKTKSGSLEYIALMQPFTQSSASCLANAAECIFGRHGYIQPRHHSIEGGTTK